MYSKYSMDSFFVSKMHVYSCIGLQICTYVKKYKFAYQGGRVQFCTPLQRIKNLYTFTEDYKFVHLCRVIQICTPKWKSTDFVHPYRGLQICITSQRITNLYSFTEDYKFVHLCKGLQICVPWCLHTRSLTGVHWITAMEYHCNHYWGHLRPQSWPHCCSVLW